MNNITHSKHGNCPANFRIQRRDDMLKVGFGDRQMESRQFVENIKRLGKKVGLFGRDDGFVCLHWKLPNNGYPNGFTNYKTYGRHWWNKEN